MEQNLHQLASDNKIKNNRPVILNPNTPVQEQVIPGDGIATTINEVIKPYKKKKKENKPLSFLETVNEDNEEDFQTFRNQMYGDEETMERKKLIRKFEKLKKDDICDLPEYKESDSLQKLRDLDKKMVSIMNKTRKVEFLWHIVWLMCYLFELAITKIGYGIRFNGWSEEVSANKREYEDYLRMMISDSMAINPKTGEEVVIKNESYLAQVDISPTMLLIFALAKSAITYTGANNFSRLATKLNNNDFKNEEDMLRNMPIPDDETDTTELPEDEEEEV